MDEQVMPLSFALICFNICSLSSQVVNINLFSTKIIFLIPLLIFIYKFQNVTLT